MIDYIYKLTNSHTEIIDLSFTSGLVPTYMKHTNLIHKTPSSDKSELPNYRYISIISYISKIKEHIVVSSQIHRYIHENAILHPYQWAYTSNKTTETTITHILNTLLSCSPKHQSILIVMNMSFIPLITLYWSIDSNL